MLGSRTKRNRLSRGPDLSKRTDVLNALIVTAAAAYPEIAFIAKAQGGGFTAVIEMLKGAETSRGGCQRDEAALGLDDSTWRTSDRFWGSCVEEERLIHFWTCWDYNSH